MLNVCIMYKICTHACILKTGVVMVSLHLKKDIVELGNIPRKAAGMMKNMIQLLH